MGLMFDPSVERRPLPALPRPEEVFLSWLMALPKAIDPALAADAEILRLNRYSGPHPGPARLLALFEAFRTRISSPSRPSTR
jgi:hypothetical protein